MLKRGFFCCFILLFSLKISAQNLQKKLDSLKGKDLKVGLVLSGGGAKGLAHIAVLQAIEQAGIRLDYIGGTSMGAIVGGLYAAGYSSKELDSLFQNTDFEKLIQDEIPRSAQSFYEKENRDRYMLSLPIRKGKIGIPSSISHGNNLYDLLKQLTYPVRNITEFSELPIPFLCVATDVENGEQVLLEEGNLALSMLASGSFPTLFSPIDIDGRLLTDGGVVNNYPVEQILEKGMDIIIGCDVQSPLNKRDNLHSAPKVLMQINSYKMVKDMRYKRTLTDLYIHPNVREYNVIDFEKGQAIIDSGRVAVEKKRHELAQIAALQRKKNQRPKIKLPEKMLVSNVTFSGNKHYSAPYLRGKIRFKWGDTISLQTLSKGVKNLIATQNFTTVRYEICPDGNQGEEFHFLLKEKSDRAQLRTAIHYDNLFKTSVLINLTQQSLLQSDDVLSADFIAGDNLRYRLDYFVDKGFYTSYGFRSQFNTFKRETPYIWGENAIFNPLGAEQIHTKVSQLTNQMYLQSIFRNKFIVGAGIEHRNIKIQLRQYPFKDVEDSHFFSAFSFLRFDSLDDKLLPTNGIFLNAHAHWYLFSQGQHHIEPFLLTQGEAGGAFKLSPSVSIKTTGSAGITIGSPNTKSLQFVFGGYGHNPLENFLPFVGYDFLSFGGYNFLKAEAVLNYQLYKKIYLNFTINFANVNPNLFRSTQWIETPIRYSGYALGFTSQTLLGPVELKWGYSPQTGKYQWLFNIGFWF